MSARASGLFCLALMPLSCGLFSRSLVAPSHAGIEYVGRFDLRDPELPRFAWPATEVRLAFTGTSLTVRLTDSPVDDETRETDWIAVFVDGRAARRIALREGTHEYELARGLKSSRHEVRIVKRTEAEVGTITLHGFELGPGERVLGVERRRGARMIEFIGDSITAGYGNEGPNATCHWSAAREDASRTYATFAAKELAADARVLAWSGKGVLRNYDARDGETMPELFELVLPADPASPVAKKEHKPDAVVINLGTNDFFPGIPPDHAFVTRYAKLLARVRARAPDAPVFVLLGPMLADDYPHPKARSTLHGFLTALVERERAAGTSVHFVEQWIDPAEGVGCDSHPNVKTHARLGRELAKAIREVLR